MLINTLNRAPSNNDPKPSTSKPALLQTAPNFRPLMVGTGTQTDSAPSTLPNHPNEQAQEDLHDETDTYSEDDELDDFQEDDLSLEFQDSTDENFSSESIRVWARALKKAMNIGDEEQDDVAIYSDDFSNEESPSPSPSAVPSSSPDTNEGDDKGDDEASCSSTIEADDNASFSDTSDDNTGAKVPKADDAVADNHRSQMDERVQHSSSLPTCNARNDIRPDLVPVARYYHPASTLINDHDRAEESPKPSPTRLDHVLLGSLERFVFRSLGGEEYVRSEAACRRAEESTYGVHLSPRRNAVSNATPGNSDFAVASQTPLPGDTPRFSPNLPLWLRDETSLLLKDQSAPTCYLRHHQSKFPAEQCEKETKDGDNSEQGEECRTPPVDESPAPTLPSPQSPTYSIPRNLHGRPCKPLAKLKRSSEHDSSKTATRRKVKGGKKSKRLTSRELLQRERRQCLQRKREKGLKAIHKARLENRISRELAKELCEVVVGLAQSLGCTIFESGDCDSVTCPLHPHDANGDEFVLYPASTEHEWKHKEQSEQADVETKIEVNTNIDPESSASLSVVTIRGGLGCELDPLQHIRKDSMVWTTVSRGSMI